MNNTGDKPSQSGKEEWFDKLVENVENQRSANITIPFKIVEIKDKGFIVKVSGLFAFISFRHMPWEYNNIESWVAISPKLIGIIFYCKIHKIEKDPLSIIINGKIPQFKKAELIIGEKYVGLIIQKSEYGVFIDIGYHFDWKCGSLAGLLHKSMFADKKYFQDCSIGDEIQIFYHGLNENGKSVYIQNNEKIDYDDKKTETENLQDLIGRIVLVRVIRKPGKRSIRLLVNDKYKGKIVCSEDMGLQDNKKGFNRAKNKLKDQERIKCEVIGLSEKAKTLELKWMIEIGVEEAISNNIGNIVDNNTFQKLMETKEELESNEKKDSD